MIIQRQSSCMFVVCCLMKQSMTSFLSNLWEFFHGAFYSCPSRRRFYFSTAWWIGLSLTVCSKTLVVCMAVSNPRFHLYWILHQLQLLEMTILLRARGRDQSHVLNHRLILHHSGECELGVYTSPDLSLKIRLETSPSMQNMICWNHLVLILLDDSTRFVTIDFLHFSSVQSYSIQFDLIVQTSKEQETLFQTGTIHTNTIFIMHKKPCAYVIQFSCATSGSVWLERFGPIESRSGRRNDIWPAPFWTTRSLPTTAGSSSKYAVSTEIDSRWLHWYKYMDRQSVGL